MLRRSLLLAAAACAATALPGSSFAQGLIWNLPPDGTQVRYEGTYSQVQFRPGTVEGDLTIEWIRHLTVKSVGTEMAEYQGETVQARWLEFKVINGVSKDGALEPGPAGLRIYKVLVPESKVTHRTVDADGIQFAFLPIIKGYRKFGEAEPTALKSPGLQIYPTISLLMHYREVAEEAGATDKPQLPAGGDSVQKLTGTFTTESPTHRTTNEAVMWYGPEIPFGLGAWTVKQTIEEKGSSEPRSNFKPISEATETMTMVGEPQTGAESELMVP